jgi:hypothetical protein
MENKCFEFKFRMHADGTKRIYGVESIRSSEEKHLWNRKAKDETFSTLSDVNLPARWAGDLPNKVGNFYLVAMTSLMNVCVRNIQWV